MTVAILIPVLKRPERVEPLLASLRASTGRPHRALFLLSAGDSRARRIALSAGAEAIEVPFPLAGGDYARKINYGLAVTDEPWVFQASDDLRFTDGWLERALEVAARNGAGVVGTNDLGNPLVKRGLHATHSLISRAYVEDYGTIDEPGLALHEGYWHCWVDNELVETAVHRRAFSSARRSIVEHLHHIWHKGEDDATYRRGQKRYQRDRELFLSRRHLWRGTRPARRLR